MDSTLFAERCVAMLEAENLSTTTAPSLSFHSLADSLSALADNHTLPLPFLAEGAKA